jgi:hypothetical protein
MSKDDIEEREAMRPYYKPHHEKFILDIERAGFEWKHHVGCLYWQGPGVEVSDQSQAEEVQRLTGVTLVCEHLGLGWIVHPRS